MPNHRAPLRLASFVVAIITSALVAIACDLRVKEDGVCAKPDDCARGLTCAGGTCKSPPTIQSAIAAKLAADRERPTPAQCKLVFDAMLRAETEGDPPEVAQMTRQIMEQKGQEEFLDDCTRRLPLAAARCFIASKTKAEYAACKDP